MTCPLSLTDLTATRPRATIPSLMLVRCRPCVIVEVDDDAQAVARGEGPDAVAQGQGRLLVALAWVAWVPRPSNAARAGRCFQPNCVAAGARPKLRLAPDGRPD